jgi:hypothetical protein
MSRTRVWRQLDPALWEFTQNPWVVLQTVSKDKLNSVLANPAFRKNIDDLLQSKRQAAEAPAWFQKNHPQSPLKCVAYFSMEYMLSEALPIYSGKGLPPVNCMPTGWMALINPAKVTGSISKNCSSIPAPQRFRSRPNGIFHRHADTTRRHRSTT